MKRLMLIILLTLTSSFLVYDIMIRSKAYEVEQSCQQSLEQICGPCARHIQNH